MKGGVVYVRYEPSGRHGEDLLRALEVPLGARKPIIERFQGKARLNPGLSHKSAVVLANLDRIFANTTVDLDEVALRQLLFKGEFRFDEDWPCELVNVNCRRELNERALVAAERNGFDAYCEFFGDSEVREGPGPVGLSPDCLSDSDLDRLNQWLQMRLDGSRR